MPRNMSFFLTTDQVIDGSKDVTRRFGWDYLKIGEQVMACQKCQGIRKGETINRLRLIEIVSIRPERADEITRYPEPEIECAREGFPEMSPSDFVEMLCKANRKKPDEICNRIEFKYV